MNSVACSVETVKKQRPGHTGLEQSPETLAAWN
jgi:hypothetical protein